MLPAGTRSYSFQMGSDDRFKRFNAGQGARFHNGDFGGRYGDELRLMVEGYVRHDTRWAALGCESPRMREVCFRTVC